MTDAPISPREDPSLPHQIKLGLAPGGTHKLTVGCNCLPSGTYLCEPKPRFEGGEALRLYHAHLASLEPL